MKLFKYLEFIKENSMQRNYIPTYEEALEMCVNDSFYESKLIVDGYNISIFNYLLAGYNDFETPIASKPNVKGFEMRGLTFVFNKDGSIFNRFVLLEKFFNLNQVSNSMYSVVKNYKIKFVNNKEDGSIASFIKLPNGKIVGKSKMGFDNEQSNGINRLYRTNKDIKKLVDWTLDNDIVAVFEYVAPSNRIVLRYLEEELILLRLRDNKTGKHLNLSDYTDIIGSVKISPFRDDFKNLDHLIELIATETDREGDVIQAEDENGNDFFFKLKTPWYIERHGLLTNDIYKENIIIGYILDEKIDDILGQIPEDEVEAHDRINRIIDIVKKSIAEKVNEIKDAYKVYSKIGSKKEYAIKYNREKNFGCVMQLVKGEEMKRLTRDEILNTWDSMADYERSLKKCEIHEIAKDWLRDNTKRLMMAREWIGKVDPTFFFTDTEE